MRFCPSTWRCSYLPPETADVLARAKRRMRTVGRLLRGLLCVLGGEAGDRLASLLDTDIRVALACSLHALLRRHAHRRARRERESVVSHTSSVCVQAAGDLHSRLMFCTPLGARVRGLLSRNLLEWRRAPVHAEQQQAVLLTSSRGVYLYALRLS